MSLNYIFYIIFFLVLINQSFDFGLKVRLTIVLLDKAQQRNSKLKIFTRRNCMSSKRFIGVKSMESETEYMLFVLYRNNNNEKSIT